MGKTVSPLTWGTPESGSDLSFTNKGVGSTREGSLPDYMYGMTNDQFNSSNLPGRSEEVFLKCFVNNNGTYYGTNLNTDLVLESTDPDVASDWVVQTTHLNATSIIDIVSWE